MTFHFINLDTSFANIRSVRLQLIKLFSLVGISVVRTALLSMLFVQLLGQLAFFHQSYGISIFWQVLTSVSF